MRVTRGLPATASEELAEFRNLYFDTVDDIIEEKAHVGRPKDKAVELELRAIRERLRARR
ncbi:MAG: hypothetical protein AB1730_14155 [Myxococcota bacterium]